MCGATHYDNHISQCPNIFPGAQNIHFSQEISEISLKALQEFLMTIAHV